MKIIHFIPSDKFTIPFVSFINDHFDINQKFIIYGKGDLENFYLFSNITYFNGSVSGFLKSLYYFFKSDKIIIHYL